MMPTGTRPGVRWSTGMNSGRRGWWRSSGPGKTPLSSVAAQTLRPVTELLSLRTCRVAGLGQRALAAMVPSQRRLRIPTGRPPVSRRGTARCGVGRRLRQTVPRFTRGLIPRAQWTSESPRTPMEVKLSSCGASTERWSSSSRRWMWGDGREMGVRWTSGVSERLSRRCKIDGSTVVGVPTCCFEESDE